MTKFEFSTCQMEEWGFLSSSGIINNITNLTFMNPCVIITKTTNKMQPRRLLYYSLSAIHVSGDVFAHHQEHLTVFTAFGSIHRCRYRLVS